MSQAEKFVPIVPTPIEQVQQVQNDNIGTSTGTAIGTTSLKGLAIKQLREQKQVQPQVQEQVQPLSLCTYPEVATGTVSSPDADEPTPAQRDHARRMLVNCPTTGGKLHCWHCSRCGDARACTAWRTHRADVELFRQSERPYSLCLIEGEEPDTAPVSAPPDYAAFCPSYWRGCGECLEYDGGRLRFCGRYNLLYDDAVGVVQ